MSELTPKVSIIIPVYNGSNYLREAVDSALAQTYKNLEVVVVNDGSDDGGKTEDIARSYGGKIRYFLKENGGVSTALNLGVKEMKGEWFAWLSHDDKYSPDRVEEDMRVIEKVPDAKVVFCIKRSIIDEVGEIISSSKFHINKVISPLETLRRENINMCSMTIHKSCFEKTGLFNPSNKTTQDVEMTLRLSKYFIFYGNENAILYVREHFERGSYKYKEQHKKDVLLLAGYLKNDFTFADLFPDSGRMTRRELSSAWSQLGNFYCYLGAYDDADDCYRKGFFERINPLSGVALKYFLGAKMRQRALILFFDLKRVIDYYK